MIVIFICTKLFTFKCKVKLLIEQFVPEIWAMRIECCSVKNLSFINFVDSVNAL